MGTFEGDDGETYDLVDTNGDGVPDFAVNQRTGRWYPIEPPGTMAPKKVKPSEHTPSEAARQQQAAPLGGGQAEDPGGVNWNKRIDWDSGIDPPMPIEFMMSAAEYIEFYGLNVEPGAIIETSALELHLFDTDTYYTDATFKWTNGFLVPNVLNYPELNYELYMLRGETPEEPWFLSLRVAGNASDVVRFGLEMSIDDYFEYEFEASGSHWRLLADGGTMMVTLYQDGSFYDQFPIE